jgi:hypothetical protein
MTRPERGHLTQEGVEGSRDDQAREGSPDTPEELTMGAIAQQKEARRIREACVQDLQGQGESGSGGHEGGVSLTLPAPLTPGPLDEESERRRAQRELERMAVEAMSSSPEGVPEGLWRDPLEGCEEQLTAQPGRVLCQEVECVSEMARGIVQSIGLHQAIAAADPALDEEDVESLLSVELVEGSATEELDITAWPEELGVAAVSEWLDSQMGSQGAAQDQGSKSDAVGDNSGTGRGVEHECVVCYEESAVILVCGHRMCGSCPVRWQRTYGRAGGAKITCPICRAVSGLQIYRKDLAVEALDTREISYWRPRTPSPPPEWGQSASAIRVLGMGFGPRPSREGTNRVVVPHVVVVPAGGEEESEESESEGAAGGPRGWIWDQSGYQDPSPDLHLTLWERMQLYALEAARQSPRPVRRPHRRHVGNQGRRRGRGWAGPASTARGSSSRSSPRGRGRGMNPRGAGVGQGAQGSLGPREQVCPHCGIVVGHLSQHLTRCAQHPDLTTRWYGGRGRGVPRGRGGERP